MNLRTVVVLAATCAIAIGACNKKDEAPAAPTGEAVPAADEAKPDEAAAADEAKPDEAAADEAKPDEAAADEAKADEAAPAAAAGDGDDAMKKAMTIQRKALEALAANKTDPAAAAAALEKLHEEHKDEIAAIQADFAKMSAKFKDDPAAAMEMMGKHMEEIQALTKLTTDLMADAPELMGSPAVAAAMGKLSPDMGGDDTDHDHDHGDHDHDDHAGHDHGDDAAAPASPLSDEDKALLDEMLVAQEKMVEILSTHAGEPDKAGEELMKYATEKADSLAKFQGVQQRLQGDQAAAMEFAQKHMPRIAALGQKLSEIVQANPELLTNEKVQAAMAKMNGGQ